MDTWKTHLRSTLYRLGRTHGNNSIADVERILCETFDGFEVRFVDHDDRPIDPDLELRELLQMNFRTAVTVEFAPGRERSPDADSRRRREPQRADRGTERPASRFQPELNIPEDQRVAWFIRELHRLFQTHDFMWAGYIVKELLPRIGMSTQEARQFLDEVNADGIVSVSKVPNPRNPDHPASGVALNLEHELVQEALERVDAAASVGADRDDE